MLKAFPEEEMATPSSILAWKISWTDESGGLQSRGSQRVGHDWTYAPKAFPASRRIPLTYKSPLSTFIASVTPVSILSSLAAPSPGSLLPCNYIATMLTRMTLPWAPGSNINLLVTSICISQRLFKLQIPYWFYYYLLNSPNLGLLLPFSVYNPQISPVN